MSQTATKRERRIVQWEVCWVSDEYEWEPTGLFYDSKAEAEAYLLDIKSERPNAFLVEVVRTEKAATVPPPATRTTKHTMKLTFDDSPEDQQLYAALRESSRLACREPLPRQAKYLLEQALARPASRPAPVLRLIPGGAGTGEPA